MFAAWQGSKKLNTLIFNTMKTTKFLLLVVAEDTREFIRHEIVISENENISSETAENILNLKDGEDFYIHKIKKEDIKKDVWTPQGLEAVQNFLNTF